MRAILLAVAALYASAACADDTPVIWRSEIPAVETASLRIPGMPARYRASAIVTAAAADIGATGPQLGLPSRLWCAAAVNRWRRQAGLTVIPSRRAVDQASHGRRIAQPVPGALMISARRGGAHVDVVAAVHDDGTITVVRPNWSRRVSLQRIRPYGHFVVPA